MHTGLFRLETRAVRALFSLGAALLLPSLLNADGKKNPASKFYVADVDGEAQIDTGDRVDDLNKKSVYNAQGTVIETKANAANAMVFSNGTGIFFDEDTRVEVKRFDQEPFLPNRTDMEVEPSVSQTQAYVPRGTIGLCTSKLVAGSNMTYRTQLGAVNIRGGKVVIQNEGHKTTISMLEGESTVTSGNINMGGHPLRNGQQAVITPSGPGGASVVKIQSIPSGQMPQLESKVTMACTAKKTVYFEARVRSQNNTQTMAEVAANAGVESVTSSTSTTSSAESSVTAGPVTAFDAPSLNSPTPTTPTSTATTPTVIVAVPVVPTNLPVQNDVSPHTI